MWGNEPCRSAGGQDVCSSVFVPGEGDAAAELYGAVGPRPHSSGDASNNETEQQADFPLGRRSTLLFFAGGIGTCAAW